MKFTRFDLLIKTAELLESLPDSTAKENEFGRQFNMDTWDCGTSACAVGHVCLTDWGKAEGLSLIPDKFSTRFNYPYYTPTGRDWYEGVGDFYGVSTLDAEFLFAPASYTGNATPHFVAERIREFVRDTPF